MRAGSIIQNIGEQEGVEEVLKLSKILNLVEKIEALTDADIKKVNNFLKGDESDLRITKTEISQMKEMGSQAKKGLKKLKGLFE